MHYSSYNEDSNLIFSHIFLVTDKPLPSRPINERFDCVRCLASVRCQLKMSPLNHNWKWKVCTFLVCSNESVRLNKNQLLQIFGLFFRCTRNFVGVEVVSCILSMTAAMVSINTGYSMLSYGLLSSVFPSTLCNDRFLCHRAQQWQSGSECDSLVSGQQSVCHHHAADLVKVASKNLLVNISLLAAHPRILCCTAAPGCLLPWCDGSRILVPGHEKWLFSGYFD